MFVFSLHIYVDYLIAGKDPDLYMIKKTETKFTNIQVVNLNTIHKLLLGECTLEGVASQPSLTKEDCKNGDAYEAATTIPSNLLESSSDLEKAIDELAVWPSWRRDERVLKPLFDIFGYPDSHEKRQLSTSEEVTPSNKKQKTG